MGAMQRNKGGRGERELCNLLTDELGVIVRRNLSQTRGGGADSLDIPGWALEVKRREDLSIGAWWRQAVAQAGDRIPVLAYRQNKRPWRFVVPLPMLRGINAPWTADIAYTAEISLVGFVLLVRETVEGA